jgi:hypothetical protein
MNNSPNQGSTKAERNAEYDLMASGNPEYSNNRMVPLGRKAKGLPKAGIIFNIVAIIVIIIWIILVVT